MVKKCRRQLVYKGNIINVLVTYGEHGYGIKPCGKKTMEYLNSLSDEEVTELWENIDDHKLDKEYEDNKFIPK